MLPKVITEQDNIKKIRPHPGPQEQFLACSADIAIFGGGAGSGKSQALLLEPTRHLNIPNFSTVFFRRTYPEIKNPGGLWDASRQLYPLLGGKARENDLSYNWRTRNYQVQIKFSHMQYEKDMYAWQGSEVPLFCFDELTHFTPQQFFYMLSRNRSTCGVLPYVRASCNPDPDSFVRELVDWYIGTNGFPIPERSGVVRYFARVDGELLWSNSRETLQKKGYNPKSFTYIPATLTDNPTLMLKSPEYINSLEAMPRHQVERLLKGNWDARPIAGDFFDKSWFNTVDAAPLAGEVVRFWDRAATEPSALNPDPDYTCGVKLRKTPYHYFIEDVVLVRLNPFETRQVIINTAAQDGPSCKVVIAKDPGQAGKFEALDLVKDLANYPVDTWVESGDKQTRAIPVSCQCKASNVSLVRGKYIKKFMDQLEQFPTGKHDDAVDALSGAYNYLNNQVTVRVR